MGVFFFFRFAQFQKLYFHIFPNDLSVCICSTCICDMCLYVVLLRHTLSWLLQLQDCMTLVNPGVSQLCLRGDRKLLALAGWDHRVRIFGWKKLQPLAALKYHTDMVQSVAFSDHQDPRQRLLAAGSKDQRISLWSVFSEEPKTA